MNLNLKFGGFSFFKVVSGSFFLALNLIFPIANYISAIVLIVGKAHSLGAWMAIWRAKKFNWLYILWLFVIVATVSFWGIKLAALVVLAFIAHVLFTFHFLFDEFDLQEEKRGISNMLGAINPFVLVSILLVQNFFNYPVSFKLLLVVTITFLLVEITNLREINWFTVQSKILTLYVILSAYFSVNPIIILNVFLAYHYFFWFIYPVYKLHKYKREERDGFIMMLLVIVAMSVFIYSSEIWGLATVGEFSVRTFYIATITHILTTAPFGYLFGLPRSKAYASA